MTPRPPGQMLKIQTPSFSHHGVAWSPYFEDKIAVASGTNFGLVGNGRLHILQLAPQGLSVFKTFDTQDCVYDVAWHESHENQVIAACGNGSLRLFDISLEGLPVKGWNEHSAEVVHVEWNNLQKETFVTASWDQTVKIFSVDRTTSLLSIPAHNAQIYTATWSPHTPSMLATCAADGLVKVFDIRNRDPTRPVQIFQVAPEEVLSCDWNKYDLSTLATGGKDKSVRIWDMRGGRTECVGDLQGHSLAVRKVQWSPHDRNVLASTSYDTTCRIWGINPSITRQVHDLHTEFCMGVAWALFDPGLIATCGWDQEVHLFRA
ncbi:hypothetical protein M231_04324 [Tremella mesenterica]|uniref:Peroxin-7 n=1 Tax=Tremella mesenterica TaxID=5217 RepID=A0A4Q1BKX0_TREME|nr:hypothetical protein M231_04324 [Tremella mesenterica]